jgi:hypothetical protein
MFEKLKMNFEMKLLFSVLSLLLVSCSYSDKDINNTMWKYSEGYYFGDYLQLNFISLRNDTILLRNKPFGIILSKKRGYFNFPGKLEIKSIETGKIGLYVDKGIKIMP